MKNLFNNLIKRSITLCFIFFFSPILFAQNQLLIKNAKTTPLANYKNTSGYNDPVKLYDGKFATGRIFWSDPNSLGWKSTGQITIDIELETLSEISSISMNTAKNEAANVFFPLNVNLFISSDGKSYQYIGDISPKEFTQKNIYKAITLSKEMINSIAKYVKIVVIPEGNMFFTDEIVIKGNKTSSTATSSAALTTSQMGKIVSENKKSEVNRRLLLNKLVPSTGVDLNQLNNLKKEILQADNLASDQVYQNYLNSINQLSVSKGGTGIQLSILASPWGKKTITANQTGLLSAINVTEYIAIEAFNNQDKGYSGSFNITGIEGVELHLYEATDVRTRKSETVKDALIPVLTSTNLSFTPGERKVFVLALESNKALKSTVKVGIGTEFNSLLTFPLTILDVGINNRFTSSLGFNVNVWPYYNYPFFKGRERQIQKDLKEHYSNVFAIPATVLEPNNLTTDHAKLKAYLRFYSADDKVLLFLSYRGYVAKPGNFMLDSWKNSYRSWYANIAKILEESGVLNENIYLYPFDEIKQNEIPAFTKFSSWIKSERPDTKIYATVFDANLLPRISPSADVVQVLASAKNMPLVKTFDKKTLWLYDIMDDSKGVDPYSRYRLLAWKAFSVQATGIGFWNYADQSGESIWNDSDGPRADYNVVYDQGNTLISSRRWEAFKQGVEDYFLLSRYAQLFGKEAALKLVIPVLASPQNMELAENVRDDIMRKIQAKK